MSALELTRLKVKLKKSATPTGSTVSVGIYSTGTAPLPSTTLIGSPSALAVSLVNRPDPRADAYNLTATVTAGALEQNPSITTLEYDYDPAKPAGDAHVTAGKPKAIAPHGEAHHAGGVQ